MLRMYPLGSESLGPSLHRNIRLIHLLNRYPLTKLGSWFLIHLIIFPRIYEDDVFSQNCHPACLWCFMIREIDRSPLLSSFPSTSPFPSLLSFSPSLLSFPPFRISSVKLCQFDQFLTLSPSWIPPPIATFFTNSLQTSAQSHSPVTTIFNSPTEAKATTTVVGLLPRNNPNPLDLQCINVCLCENVSHEAFVYLLNVSKLPQSKNQGQQRVGIYLNFSH